MSYLCIYFQYKNWDLKSDSNANLWHFLCLPKRAFTVFDMESSLPKCLKTKMIGEVSKMVHFRIKKNENRKFFRWTIIVLICLLINWHRCWTLLWKRWILQLRRSLCWWLHTYRTAWPHNSEHMLNTVRPYLRVSSPKLQNQDRRLFFYRWDRRNRI